MHRPAPWDHAGGGQRSAAHALSWGRGNLRTSGVLQQQACFLMGPLNRSGRGAVGAPGRQPRPKSSRAQAVSQPPSPALLAPRGGPCLGRRSGLREGVWSRGQWSGWHSGCRVGVQGRGRWSGQRLGHRVRVALGAQGWGPGSAPRSDGYPGQQGSAAHEPHWDVRCHGAYCSSVSGFLFSDPPCAPPWAGCGPVAGAS